MVCSQLPWTWAMQRCCVLWEHQPLWLQDQGSVPLAQSTLLGSAAHCSGVSGEALTFGRPALLVAAWSILNICVAPIWIWCNKCSEHKCLMEHESKIRKGQEVVSESFSETEQSLSFFGEARLQRNIYMKGKGQLHTVWTQVEEATNQVAAARKFSSR